MKKYILINVFLRVVYVYRNYQMYDIENDEMPKNLTAT